MQVGTVDNFIIYLWHTISMNNEILCSVCGIEIWQQKVLMCADCKIGIKVEYEGIKKQSKNQRDRELREYKRYSFFGI